MNEKETFAYTHLVEIARVCGLTAALSQHQGLHAVSLASNDWPPDPHDATSWRRRRRVFTYINASTPLEAITGALQMSVHSLLGNVEKLQGLGPVNLRETLTPTNAA